MSDPVRVLVVDDQAVARDATRHLLAATPEFRLVGEAATGVEALAAIERLEPDLVLLDVRMPEMDGIEAAQRISQRERRPVIVLMSSDSLTDARTCGASAFVAKEHLRGAVLRELWAQHAPIE